MRQIHSIMVKRVKSEVHTFNELQSIEHKNDAAVYLTRPFWSGINHYLREVVRTPSIPRFGLSFSFLPTLNYRCLFPLSSCRSVRTCLLLHWFRRRKVTAHSPWDPRSWQDTISFIASTCTLKLLHSVFATLLNDSSARKQRAADCELKIQVNAIKPRTNLPTILYCMIL